eukprot:77283_1
MANQANESEFGKGDVVKMVGLKSKPQWNGKLATINGPFNKEKGRWPIQISFGNAMRALLQTKNLKLVEKKQLKNDSNDSINVVEIQSNRGGFVGPLGNKLKNVKFSKSQLWKHMKKKKLKEYKSPFAKLLGYDLSILVDPNTSDHQNNAGAVYLTSDLSNGLSPYQQ